MQLKVTAGDGNGFVLRRHNQISGCRRTVGISSFIANMMYVLYWLNLWQESTSSRASNWWIDLKSLDDFQSFGMDWEEVSQSAIMQDGHGLLTQLSVFSCRINDVHRVFSLFYCLSAQFFKTIILWVNMVYSARLLLQYTWSRGASQSRELPYHYHRVIFSESESVILTNGQKTLSSFFNFNMADGGSRDGIIAW